MQKNVNTLDRNGVVIELGAVEAMAIYDQIEGNHVAHVKQSIVSKYPTKKFGNKLSSGLFVSPEDSFTEYESFRHTLVKIPTELTAGNDKDLSTVQSQLDQFPGTIQRIVSHNLSDVLTEGDEWALENIDEVTIEALQDRYETRDTAGNRYSSGKRRIDIEDGVIDETLPMEFSRRVYQNSFVEDTDHRSGSLFTEQIEEADSAIAAKITG